MQKQNKFFKRGVWPVALTPFKKDKSVDYNAYELLLEWYIKNQVSGIYAVCLSSEMYLLNNKEQFNLAKLTAEITKNRCQCVASGGFGETLEQKVDSIKRVSESGVDGVVMPLCNLVSQEESEFALKKNIEYILANTGDIKLGIYECPLPYHRLIGDDLLKFCADSNRFYFMKDTCCDAKILKSRIEICKKSNIALFNANVHTLQASMEYGADGYNGTAANYYPDLIKEFIDGSKYQQKLNDIIVAGELLTCLKYLRGAKYFISLEGVDIDTVCRTEIDEFSRYDCKILCSYHSLVENWRKEIKNIQP